MEKENKNGQEQNAESFLCFKNITGQEKTISITSAELKDAFSFGVKVDASDIIGLTGICETEFILRPDKNVRIIHQKSSKITCFCYPCSVTTIDGTDISEISDILMQSALTEAKSLGFNDRNDSQLMEFLFPATKPTLLHVAS
jgi:glutamine synthetase